eukprot:s7_g9.t1
MRHPSRWLSSYQAASSAAEFLHQTRSCSIPLFPGEFRDGQYVSHKMFFPKSTAFTALNTFLPGIFPVEYEEDAFWEMPTRGRRRSRRTRHRSRQSSESSATSTSRSDGDSSGEGSQNSSDSKPPGNLMAIRGSSRFCSVCGQHLGWVEKSSTGATQKAPEPICSSCQAKAVEKAAEAPVAEAAKPAESEEEGMEVDEWGFQMALDQVKEAACADDALAVMEALVDSKPSAEFLEAASWSTKLSEVQSSPSAGSTDGSVTTSVSIRGARTAQSAQPADSEDGREQSLQFVQGYRYFPGTNCWHDPGLGSNYLQGAASAVDVGYVGKVSAQVCADHCNANPRCEGFVIMPSEQQCWMRGFINMGMCKFETKHYDLYDLAESSSEHWPAAPSSVPDYKYLPEVNCYKDFGAVDLSYAGAPCSQACASGDGYQICCAGQYFCQPNQGEHGEVLSNGGTCASP